MATRTKVKGLTLFLKEKRIEAGLTQLQASQVIGHQTAQYVSNFERGLCEPSVEKAMQLCEAYDVSRRELYEVLVHLYQSALSETLSLKRARGRKA